MWKEDNYVFSIGTDIVSIRDVENSIKEFSDNYINKIFTLEEIIYCNRFYNNCSQNFAVRFAAKEAAIKVLRPIKEHIKFKDIELIKNKDGSCELAFYNSALTLVNKRGFSGFSVSVSHEDEYAIASVIGWKKREE